MINKISKFYYLKTESDPALAQLCFLCLPDRPLFAPKRDENLVSRQSLVVSEGSVEHGSEG